MKQGNSDTYPEEIVASNNFFQCRYNILPSVREGIEGNRTSYNYDYVEVKELSEALILDALVENGCNTPESVMQSITDYQGENGILGNIEEENLRILSLD